MTIYKSWIQSLICDCAEYQNHESYDFGREKISELIQRVNRIFTYYSLENTSEYNELDRLYRNIGNRSFSVGVNESNALKLINILIGLKRYETSVPKRFDRVFISHSSADIDIVLPFVQLLTSIGLTNDKLFCSSVDGYGIPQRENIYDFLKREFTDKNTFVIMIMSDNYYNSKPSLNEMGAAWVMSKEYVSILIKGFEFNQIEGAADSQKIGFKISDSYRLDEFKDNLVKELRLPNTANWDSCKSKFLKAIEEVNK